MERRTSKEKLLLHQDQYDSNGEPLKTRIIWIFSFFTCLLSLEFGYVSGIASPILVSVSQHFDFSESNFKKQLFVAVAVFGAVIGALVLARLPNIIGRRFATLFNDCIYIIGILFCVFASSFSWLIIGRFIQGVGFGFTSVVGIMFITEISPKAIRGQIGTLFQLFITLGILCSYIVGYFVAGTGAQDWRIMFAIGIAPVAFHLAIGSFITIESPVWLLKQGREKEAEKNLQRLLKKKNVYNEIKEFTEQSNPSNDQVSTSPFRELFTKYRRSLIIAIGLNFFQQASGINGIIYYMSTIYSMAGFNQQTANLITMGNGVIIFFFTIVSAYLIDRLGRRKLLLYPIVGLVGSLIFCFLSLLLIKEDNARAIATIISLVLYLIFFAVSYGPIAWIVTAEVLPMEVKAQGMSLSVAVNWGTCFFVTQLFLSLAQSFTLGGEMLMYGFICFLGYLFVFFIVPETKGKDVIDLIKKINKLDEHPV